MSSGRTPWELIALVILAALVGKWFGEGTFMVLIWIALGIYALVVLAPFFRGLAIGLGWVVERVDGLLGPDSKWSSAYIDDPRRDVYLAICRRDIRAIKRIVEDKGVDPFAPFPREIQPRTCDARTLYGCAQANDYSEAVEYFGAWQLEKNRKLLAR